MKEEEERVFNQKVQQLELERKAFRDLQSQLAMQRRSELEKKAPVKRQSTSKDFVINASYEREEAIRKFDTKSPFSQELDK